MKKLSLSLACVLAIGSFAAAAHATSPDALDKICKSLQMEFDDACAHTMCDDSIANGTFKDLSDCVGAEDYMEAAQEGCDSIPSVEDLAKQYNKKHPGAKVSCET